MKFRELPEIIQNMLKHVQKLFMRDGYLATIVFSFGEGDTDATFRDVSALLQSEQREKIESIMIRCVKQRSHTVGMVSEGWAVEKRSSEKDFKKTLAAAKNRRLNKHPDRVQVIMVNVQTAGVQYLCTAKANVMPRVMQPWDIIAMTDADMVDAFRTAGLNDGPMMQNIFRKANGNWPPRL